MGGSTLLWVSLLTSLSIAQRPHQLEVSIKIKVKLTMCCDDEPTPQRQEREKRKEMASICAVCMFPCCKGMNSPCPRFPAPNDLLDSNPASQRLSRDLQDPTATPVLPDAGISSQYHHGVAGLRGQQGSLSMGGTARGRREAEEERTTLLSESQHGIACVWSPASHHDR